MAFIRQISDEQATGLLARIYDSCKKRAGKVFNILRVMSLSPRTLQSSTALYTAIMFGESEISRSMRELLAVVVSKSNDCFY